MKDPQRDQYVKELAERITLLRTWARKTPEQMADALDVKVDTYKRWEDGRTQFPMHKVLGFSRATGYPPGFVVTGIPNDDWKADEGTETGTFKRPPLPDQDDN